MLNCLLGVVDFVVGQSSIKKQYYLPLTALMMVTGKSLSEALHFAEHSEQFLYTVTGLSLNFHALNL